MKVVHQSDFAANDKTAKEQTSKTLNEWFKVIDAFGGIEKGRRAIGQYLSTELKVDPWWSTTLNVEYEAHRGQVEKDGRPKGYMICSTKTINAPLKSVYEAFSTAKSLDQWFGSKNKLDFKEGGALSNADGNVCSIKKIRPEKAIKLTWDQKDQAQSTVVEVTFQKKSDTKSGVMIAHDRIANREEADGLRNAWAEALARLKSLLE